MHDPVTETFVNVAVQNLREDVCDVVGGRDVSWNEDVLVPKCLDPVLTCVDVLQLRLIG